LYGRGSSFPGARLEIVTFRCRATAITPRPQLRPAATLEDGVAAGASTGSRDVWWAERKECVATPVYDGQVLRPGNQILGPAVIETPDTTVVVHPGQSMRVDSFGNFEIALRE
jgi:N-methylhydantoinase A